MRSNPPELSIGVRTRSAFAGSCLVASIFQACASQPPSVPVFAEIGEPVPGLAPAELARFNEGRLAFTRSFTPDDGLGPRFNESACNACHTDPQDGGTGETLVTKATLSVEPGSCNALTPQGGENVRLRVTPLAAAAGARRPAVPAEATHIAQFTIPFLFGMGLVDLIPQSTLDDLADPDDANGDGISGQVGRDPSGRPGRFGRKADVATLADFNEGAFRLEMGVTTPNNPIEATAGDLPPTGAGTDPADDPEVDDATLAAVLDFVRMLAPPAPSRTADPELVAQGEKLFFSIGCVSCHRPTLESGTGDIPALSRKVIALYSDLLLHDMGAGLEGTCASGATPTEWRTEPLMGLRFRRLFLHDGRAGRVRDAILLHGGEAERARDAFAALDRVTQEAVLRFLDTL